MRRVQITIWGVQERISLYQSVCNAGILGGIALQSMGWKPEGAGIVVVTLRDDTITMETIERKIVESMSRQFGWTPTVIAEEVAKEPASA